jgi:hypothetical protein
VRAVGSGIRASANPPSGPAGRSVVEDGGREPVSDDDVEEIADQAGDRDVAARSLATKAPRSSIKAPATAWQSPPGA